MKTTYSSNFCFFVLLIIAVSLFLAITFYCKAYSLHQWLDAEPFRFWHPEKFLDMRYYVLAANFCASIAAATAFTAWEEGVFSFKPEPSSDVLDDEAPTDSN